MNKFDVSTMGKGPKLVLIHGWGSNSNIWIPIAQKLSETYKVYLVDIPGYGLNKNNSSLGLDAISTIFLEHLPKDAVWVGWSLGGLIVKYIATHYRNTLGGIITVCSSPCFTKQMEWDGLDKNILQNFECNLIRDYKLTLNKFLTLQFLGTKSYREDLANLKKLMKKFPDPNVETLQDGLSILKNHDLRKIIHKVDIPFLRIYGKNDRIVPISIANKFNNLHGGSQCEIFENSSHAPFISEPDAFLNSITRFTELS